MKEISDAECKQPAGGFVHIVIGSALNLSVYTYKKWQSNEPMTFKGALISASTGAMTGGIGNLCIKAAGGGLVGNLWRPGFVALNASGQKIANTK